MRKILAIDDQADNLTTIKAVVKNSIPNCMVITAMTGQEGLNMAVEEQPDTILLDIIMPSMDGYEVCAKLKANELTNHIPIIMLTAIRTDSDSRVKGLNLGADSFLSKPIDLAELTAQVNVMLRIKAAEDKLREEKVHLEEQVVERTHDLYESEKKYKALYDNAPLPYQSIDIEGNIKDVNPSWLKTLGFKREEVIGKSFFSLLHPESKKKAFNQIFPEFKLCGYIHNIEFKIKHKQGYYIDISYEGCASYNTDGSFKQTYCVFKDITDIKKAEKALINEQLFTKAVIDSMPGIFYLYSYPEMQLLRWNKNHETVLGYSAEDLKNMRVKEWLIDENRNIVMKAINETIENGTFSAELNLNRKNRKSIPFMITSTRFETDGKQYVLGVGIDNTFRKKAEALIKESDRKITTLIDNLQGIAYRCKNDANWTMEFISAGFKQITGYEPSDVINNNKFSFNDIMVLEDRKRVRETVQLALKKGTKIEYSYRIITATGDIRTVLEKGVGVFSEKTGELIALEGFITDITELEQTKNELINKNQFIESIINLSPDTLYIYDINENKNVYSSKSIFSILNYSVDEIKELGSKVVSQLMHPNDFHYYTQEIYPKYFKASDNEFVIHEYRMKNKKGMYQWLESREMIYKRDLQGKPTQIFGVIHDITLRKKSEEKITKLSMAVEQSPAIIAITDLSGKVDYVNPKYTELTGFDSDEILGHNLSLLKSGTQSSEEYRILWDTISMGNEWRGLLHNKTKNGKLFWESATISPILDKQGKIVNYLKVAEDITDQKRSEQIQKVLFNISNAVATSNNLLNLIRFIRDELRAIIDTTNFYIVLYDDITGKIEVPYYTDEKDVFTSIPAGKSLTRYVIETQKPLLADVEKKKQLQNEGKIEQIGSVSKIWLGVPLKTHNKISGVIAMQSYTDEFAYNHSDMKMLEFISDQISISIRRKRDEEDLTEAVKKAQESDLLKTAFLANMSHEIRTPMNAIIGFSEFLTYDDLTEEERQNYAEYIRTNGNSLVKIIDDIIDISKLQSKQVVISLSNFELNNLFQELEMYYNKVLLGKTKSNINLSFKYSENDETKIFIKSDEIRLKQILNNLISNAIKYTEEGSISVGFNIDGDRLEIFVLDTGIGIPEEQQPQIFDRFVQFSQQYIARQEGTGLGLSISKELVELLGGELKVSSTFGVGSKFYFKIPLTQFEILYKENKGEKSESINEITYDFSNHNILIVDDEESNYILTKRLLRNSKANVDWASNGKEAVKKVKSTKYHIIIMDIKMPEMDGIEATKLIRENDKIIPIIIQTAFAMPTAKADAFKAGCNDFIIRPFQFNDFMKLIQSYIIK